jgi:drug/metabolite transporter (DMT)-like permease
MAPVATAVYLAVVLALVVGRYRWAWLLLALLNGAAVIGWAFDPQRFAPARALGYGVGLAALCLLVSWPMRRRLRHPVLLPWRVKDGAPAP